jgi:GntP family gluconate:H+ symporter
LWLALMPIVTPVVLIAAAALTESMDHKPAWLVTIAPALRTLGDKNVALTVAAAIGLLTFWLRRTNSANSAAPRDTDAKKAVAEALSSAAVMVLIISAGGAFGHVLRQTDIAATIKDLVPVSKLALLPLAFLLAAAARTAQGSAIVSMITAVAIVAPLAAGASLGYHPVYLACAIGCGSKPIMWMNDAGFWIITKTSGLTEAETLKTATIQMTIMGVVGLLATMLAAWALPMG